VVIKGIDGLKSAVRPFGLNQPLITVTQYDVKKRSSLGRAHFNNVAGICDGQRATLWNLVEGFPIVSSSRGQRPNRADI
jgi:hypothetical protein